MNDFACTFISGAIGGAGLVAAGQPFDTVKVKMQTFPEMYPSGRSCARAIYQAEGMRGLYAGSTSAVMVNVAENSVLFGARSFTIGWTASYFKTKELNDFQMALAGSGAAFFSSIVVCPTELVKTRMQAATELSKSGHNQNTTVRATVAQILSEGPTAPFRGLVGTWGRECPGYLILFYAYQKCYNFIRHHELLSANFNAALSGGIAGGCYWAAMLPIDAVKSRQQVLSIGSSQSIPFVQCAKGLYQTAGLRGFYAGLAAMLMRTIPANGVLFGLVEATEPMIRNVLFN